MREAALLRELEYLVYLLPVKERAALFAILVHGYAVEDVCFGVGETLGETRRLFKTGADTLRQVLEEAGLPRLSLIALGELLRRLPVPAPSPGFLRRLSALLKQARTGAAGRSRI
jgi:hypothetical protein